MAGQGQANLDQFEAYFKRADLDHDGRISGNEAVSFFQGSNLTKQVLAQIWVIADQNRIGFLGRQEFYNMLKLVTVAQSKRELTPDIVKAALYGPASAKIPAPLINLAPTSTQQVNVVTTNLSASSLTTVTTTGPQVVGPRGSQGFTSQQNVVMRPHIPVSPGSNIQTHEGVLRPPLPPNGRNIQVSDPPNAAVRPVASSFVSQLGVTNSMRPSAQDQRAMLASGFLPSTQVAKGSSLDTKISGAVTVKENRLPSDSLFGDVYSASAPQTTQGATVVASYSSSPAPSAMIPGSQLSVESSQLESFPNTPQQPMGSQHQHGYLSVQSSLKASHAFPVGGINPNGQSQASWPRMTQMDVQKYAKVFMQVDTDRDGKITGEQARNLFLSWRQPREVLKQVWDLSDQDNDSMLSLREFCISLYLMERYREGHLLPKTLPGSVIDETLFTGSSYPPGSQGNDVLRTIPGFQQPQIIKSTRAVSFGGASKPPRPVPISQHGDAMQPSRQKPKVPVLEKHLLDQLSSEEQSSLNSKLQEATEADKKVAELEKEILDAKEKIQFYHAKMQELILYKSRCDNRLNEIVERVSADKREVDSLAKKYEEKYRQAGDVASKLTIEEATFRHIQEKKMELYRAIVKLEQEGSADSFQEQASHIQLDLEELVRSLNERCKTYGLRTKPTSLVELPFGWQPGIQGAAADWDENWDKFEDEGFTLVKELTLDVQNVIAPPKPKSTIVGDKEASRDVGVAKLSSDADVVAAKVQNNDERIAENGVNIQGEEQTFRSYDSPTKSNGFDTRSRDFESSHLNKEIGFDGSPHASHGEHEAAESVFSGDKAFNELSWGTFDSHYDTDAAWDFNHVTTKDSDSEIQRDTSLFGSDEWGLHPIRTGSTYAENAPSKQGPFFDSVPSTPLYNSGSSPQADNMFQGKSLFFDSVPSTPMYNSGSSAQADNVFQNKTTFFDSVPSTPMYNNSGSSTQADNVFQNKSTFFDSVPSTPMYNSDNSAQADNMFQKSTFFDSVPSTPMYKADGSPREDNLFQRKSPFAFADSVPSTPMSNHVTSPRRYSEASEDRSFDSFSRFDSFNAQDGGLFAPHDSSLSRFDSMRSTRDAASLSRFDSMRSTKESEYDPGIFAPRDSFARFDSFRSTADSDYNFGLFPPQDSFSRFDSMNSSKASDFSHGFSSFDNSDPFGSSDPFKTSFENQTPRNKSDGWKAS